MMNCMIALLALIGASVSFGSAPACASQLPVARMSPSSSRLEPLANTILAQQRKLRWNGKVVTEAELARYLSAAANLSPVPPLLIKLDYRDCAFAQRIEQQIKASTFCSRGTCYSQTPQ